MQRPYLNMCGKEGLEEVWRPYEGVAPRWVFVFLNECTRGAWGRQLVRGQDCSGVMECYQEAIGKNELERIYIFSRAVGRGLEAKGDKRSKTEMRRAYIKACIRNLFRTFWKKEEERKMSHESFDETLHDVEASFIFPEREDEEAHLLLWMVMRELDEEDRVILELYRRHDGDVKGCIEQLDMSYATWYRRFEKASCAFLARCGLEEMRRFIKVGDDTETKKLRLFFDVWIEEKGSIGRAAEFLGMTREDCRDMVREILVLLKTKCGGMKNIVMNCLATKRS